MSINNIEKVRIAGRSDDSFTRLVRTDKNGNVQVGISGPVATGGLTDTQLRATAVPVGSTQVTIPWQVANKKLAGTTYAPRLFSNFGADSIKTVKASSGNVFSLTCSYISATGFYTAGKRWLQLFDENTPHASGIATNPICAFYVPQGSQIIVGSDFFTSEGWNFAAGITFAWSNTRDTYVIATSSEHQTFISYDR